MRGAGSKRKQPSSSVPAGATAHQQQQQQQHAASGPSHILPSAAAAAVGECQSRLLLSEAELDVAAAALPLPPVAQRLEAAFAVLAQVHAFLTAQHIQVRRVRCWAAVIGIGQLAHGRCVGELRMRGQQTPSRPQNSDNGKPTLTTLPKLALAT
jgi:hypothetical protein